MPRDWKNDPEAIRRYCTCRYMPTSDDRARWEAAFTGNAYFQEDGTPLMRMWANPDCKLHSSLERFDLPPEFP